MAVIDGVIAELRQMPAEATGQVKATRLAVVRLLRRVKRMIGGQLQLPPFNADQIASALIDLIGRAGLDQYAETIACMAGNIGDLLTVGTTLADLVPVEGFGPGSLGAAAAAPSRQDKYQWYASWLHQTRTRPWYYNFWTWLPFHPPDEVWMDKDNTELIQRNVHRADTTLHTGSGIEWHQAPIFRSSTTGEHYNIERLSANFMEEWTLYSNVLVTVAKFIMHPAWIEDGNFATHIVYSIWYFFNTVWSNITRTPFNSWLNANFGGPQWTRWLIDFFFPAAITSLCSMEGRHTEADEAKFPFWAILLADDALEAITIDALPSAVKEFFLSLFTLINYDGPPSADPTNDTRPLNRLHVDGIIDPLVFLSSFLMMKTFPRDRYTYIGDDRGRPDQNKFMWGEWMFGINTGFTMMGVMAGWFLTSTIGRAWDIALLGKLLLKHLLKNWALFWVTVYSWAEGDTDDGKYNPVGDDFDGYAGHSNSPYKLPFASSQAFPCVQGNQGMWSHNNFGGGTSQVYAIDFGMDQGEEILACRSGTVVDFGDGIPDNDPSDWNYVVIRHDNPFAGVDAAFTESAEQRNAHDKGPRGEVVQTYAVYGHGRNGSVTELLEACRVAQSLADIRGVRVKQGTPIMRAGHTGHSFHNHLHLHIQVEPPAAGTNTPNTSTAVPFVLGDLDDYTLPFVFQDVSNIVGADGLPKSLTFYKSRNTKQSC